MKYLMLFLLLTGCTKSNEYGKCIGVNGKEDIKLDYEYSTNNIVLGLIFFETLIVPAVVILDELKCPIGFSKNQKDGDVK